MSPAFTGATVGLAGGLGLLLVVVRAPWMRRTTLTDRVAPHLRVSAAPSLSSLLGYRHQPPGDGRRLLRLAAGRLDRLLGGRVTLAARLAAAGGRCSVEDYRISQLLWAFAGALPGAVLLAGGTLTSRPSLSLAGVALFVAGSVGGIAARDAALGREIKTRNAAMLAELPAVAELLSLAVSAGESPLGALHRVTRIGGGPLRQELSAVLADVRSGAPLVYALDALAARTSVTALARFLDGLVVAVERGTPLADVLRSQAADVREAAKRGLIEAGGRKEIAMMVPVVFLVLPTVVLFAAYPAFRSLTFVTG